MILYFGYTIHLYTMHLGKKKDEIKNLGINKAYEKSCLVAKIFSAATSIVCYGGINTAQLGLIRKMGEPPRISSYISHPD